MQMGREFGLCSLLSLPSSQGSCQQLTHNLCYKCHCHVLFIWRNKVFQLHMEINIPELCISESHGMVWIGLEGAKRSSLCVFGNQGVLSLWIFLPLFYMIFGKAVLCYHHAKVRFSNTFKLSGAKVSLGINPLAAIDLHQRGILARSW